MIIMKKITILCLLLLGIGLAGLQAQQRIKVKRLPIDTYEADYEGDAEGFEEPTGSDFNTGRTGETAPPPSTSTGPVNPEDLEGEKSDEGSNPGCPDPSSNARVASSDNCGPCDEDEYRDECGVCRKHGTFPPDTNGNGIPDCLECEGVKDLAGNCCQEKKLITVYYDEDGDGYYEKKVKVCPKTIEGNIKFIPTKRGREDCTGGDEDNDGIPDDCDECDNTLNLDYDGDGINDCIDKCDNTLDLDDDGDGINDCIDTCIGYYSHICDRCIELGHNEKDTDGDFVPDECDQCPNGNDRIDENNNGIPDCVEKPACSSGPNIELNDSGNKSPSLLIRKGHFGVTGIEDCKFKFAYCYDAGIWRIDFQEIIGTYNIYVRLPGKMKEASVAAATDANFCQMVGSLASYGNTLATWYSTPAVEAHENVHLNSLSQAFHAAAAQAVREVSTITGKTMNELDNKFMAKRNDIIQGFWDTWAGQYDTSIKTDHHGPTYAAEDTVLIPLIKAICNSRSSSVRSQCVNCP